VDTGNKRKRKKKSKIYFGKDTENAIIEYNNTEDIVERNKIYNERISYAFDKLAENILNTFKFSYFQCSHLEVQQEVVSNLVSNIHKYKPDNGKAFSYFSIIAKNFLILYNNGNYRKFKKHVSVDDEETTNIDLELSSIPTNPTNKKEISEFFKLMIDYWDVNIEKIFKKQNELQIAYAVLEIFRNSDRIENFNKKALYLYIREMTNCKTQNITKVVNKMKDMQKRIQIEYKETGDVKNDY
tara:strand:+ start:863 stop:1585 length:723 start_codon:yes stop_codon:yes gene_type:complete